MSSITIIGTGGMAAAIAGRASAAGHTIQVLSRSTASAEAFADRLGSMRPSVRTAPCRPAISSSWRCRTPSPRRWSARTATHSQEG